MKIDSQKMEEKTENLKEEKNKRFEVVVLGVIYDPRNKKVLIGKRFPDKHIKNLTWAFPGGKIHEGEDVDQALKRNIKKKTGLEIENVGALFTRIPEEKDDLLLIFFLTEAFGGELKADGDFEQLKWVHPKEMENHFTTSMHPKLKEIILDLV